MKLCMVGYGAIAEKHMEAFRQLDEVHPHVLVGRRPEPSAEFARQWGFAHHSLDLASAVKDYGVDAVVITSPNEQHCPQATVALEAGKDVLLEIPMAMNYPDAKKVTELSRRVNRRLMICHSMRYIPAMMEVRRRVVEGRLRLHHIINFFGVLRRTNTSWTGKVRSWTDNILWHHGGHMVDLAMWMVGARHAHSVQYLHGPPHPQMQIMDFALSFRLPGDVVVNISQSYNINHLRQTSLFIGEEETVEFCNGDLLDGEGNQILPAGEGKLMISD